jgi:hypothetical protein
MWTCSYRFVFVLNLCFCGTKRFRIGYLCAKQKKSVIFYCIYKYIKFHTINKLLKLTYIICTYQLSNIVSHVFRVLYICFTLTVIVIKYSKKVCICIVCVKYVLDKKKRQIRIISWLDSQKMIILFSVNLSNFRHSIPRVPFLAFSKWTWISTLFQKIFV